MKTPTAARAGLVLILTVTGACAGDSADGAGGAASALEAACNKNTNTPPEACECLATGAEENLSPPAVEWLAAAMSGETELAVKMKDGIPIADLLQASTFLMNYAEQCAVPETALSQIQ